MPPTVRRPTDRELEESLRDLGALHPIVTFNGQIYDGRRRERFCQLFGLPFATRACASREELLRVLWLVEPERAISEAGKLTIAQYAEAFNVAPLLVARVLRDKRERAPAKKRSLRRARNGGKMETLINFWCSSRLRYCSQLAADLQHRSLSDYIRQALQDKITSDLDPRTLRAIDRGQLIGPDHRRPRSR